MNVSNQTTTPTDSDRIQQCQTQRCSPWIHKLVHFHAIAYQCVSERLRLWWATCMGLYRGRNEAPALRRSVYRAHWWLCETVTSYVGPNVVTSRKSLFRCVGPLNNIMFISTSFSTCVAQAGEWCNNDQMTDW